MHVSPVKFRGPVAPQAEPPAPQAIPPGATQFGAIFPGVLDGFWAVFGCIFKSGRARFSYFQKFILSVGTEIRVSKPEPRQVTAHPAFEMSFIEDMFVESGAMTSPAGGLAAWGAAAGSHPGAGPVACRAGPAPGCAAQGFAAAQPTGDVAGQSRNSRCSSRRSTRARRRHWVLARARKAEERSRRVQSSNLRCRPLHRRPLDTGRDRRPPAHL